MVSTLIYIKHRFETVWGMVEKINSFLLGFTFPRVKKMDFSLLRNFNSDEFEFSLVDRTDIDALIDFRVRQRDEYLRYFDPHRFDRATIERMLGNQSYILMKVMKKDHKDILGYFFLRCFFIGKAFHGLIVDEKYTNRGLGTKMWRISNELCKNSHLRMFATISKHNIPSLKSASNAGQVKVSEKLDNDFLLIECYPKKTS